MREGCRDSIEPCRGRPALLRESIEWSAVLVQLESRDSDGGNSALELTLCAESSVNTVGARWATADPASPCPGLACPPEEGW